MDSGGKVGLTLICLIDNLAKGGTLLKVARSIGIQVETQNRLDKWLALIGSSYQHD